MQVHWSQFKSMWIHRNQSMGNRCAPLKSGVFHVRPFEMYWDRLKSIKPHRKPLKSIGIHWTTLKAIANSCNPETYWHPSVAFRWNKLKSIGAHWIQLEHVATHWKLSIGSDWDPGIPIGIHRPRIIYWNPPIEINWNQLEPIEILWNPLQFI